MRKNDVRKQQARVRKELGLVVFRLCVYYSLRFIVGYACAYEEGEMAMGLERGTYPLTPLLATLRCRLRLCLRGRGNGDGFCDGNGERFLGFYGVIHSPKAIKTDRDTNLSESHALPLVFWKKGLI